MPNQVAAVYEANTHSLETTKKGIRTFAKNTAALVAVQATTTTTATSSRDVRPLISGPTTAASNIVPVPAFPGFPKSQRQLELEWEQNRKYLERLINYGLFESAEKIQQRGLLIKEELSNHHGVPFLREERDEMEGRLVDILFECKVEGSKEKAVSFLEKKLRMEYAEYGGTEQLNNLIPLPYSSMDPQRRLSFHYKLGRLYKEMHQIKLAESHLREAFNAYCTETPKDMPKIRQAGEGLFEVYQYQVEFGDIDHRPVYLSQLQAFKQELLTVMGRPFMENRRDMCIRAIEWCQRESIAVSFENDEPRFDSLDEWGSSPLHHAAEKCRDEHALQQMMDNSDTLENRDFNEDTPLLVAVASSNTTALAVLLQKGASVKARDRQRQTPLHISKKSSVTKFLLHHRLRRASTVSSGLFEDGRRFSSASFSTFATSPPSSIPDQDFDIDAQDAHRKTALYLACSQGRDKIAGLLLLAGADPNIAAHDHTPLAATIESQARSYINDPKKKIEIVAALISRGADPEAGKKVLWSSRGMQKEILKALEGRAGSQLLQPSSISMDWSLDGRDSGYYELSSSSFVSSRPYEPSSVSFVSTRPSTVSRPSLHSSDFTMFAPEERETPDPSDILAAEKFLGTRYEKQTDSSHPGKVLPSRPFPESFLGTHEKQTGSRHPGKMPSRPIPEGSTGPPHEGQTDSQHPGRVPSHPLQDPSEPGPSTGGQQQYTPDSSPTTTFAESSSDSDFSEEWAIDVSTKTVTHSVCGHSNTPDVHRSSRFSDPEQWQMRLAKLEAAVLTSSSISCYIDETSPLFTKVDDHTLQFNASLSWKTSYEVMGSERRQLLSVAEGIIKSIGILKHTGYCGEFVSLIVADTKRTNVATLTCITLSDIVATTSQIKVALTSLDVSDSQAAIVCCEAFLTRLGSAPKSELVNQAQHGVKGFHHQWRSSHDAHHAVILSRIVLQILDLAILSYCGAHLEPLHPNFPCISGVPRLLLAPGLSLTQQKLRCLGQLLQSPVWVFDIGGAVKIQSDSDGLWLSTTIEAFADVWGPAWPVAEPEQPYTIARIDVGQGSIIGWKRAPDEPDTTGDEVFCHWISAFDSRPTELCVGGELQSKRLLIGGRLIANDDCTMCPEDFTVRMKDKNRLRDLSGGQSQWYTDARTLNWSLGVLGITAGAQETYKRRNESYRDALSTALQKDDFDSTLCVLRRRCVVEISACTGLARRQSVLYALSSPGLENYLKKSDMEWDENERDQYFEILRESLAHDNLDTIRTHLKEARFGDLMKKALKKSFCNVLLKTGRLVKEDLAAFWSFERDGEDDPGVLISYPSWDYSWTGLLHEGSLGFNAAMVSPICLELQKRKHPSESLPCAQGPCLNNNRYTLLETLLCVNRRELEPPKGLKLVAIEDERSYYAERWSVRDIVGGEVFHLGEQGKLKILGRMKWLDSGSKRSGLLTEWNDPKPSRLREATQEIRLKIGKTAEPPCHREYLGPGRADRNGPAPIIIHVVSHGNLAMGR